jgi:hypothetical protein
MQSLFQVHFHSDFVEVPQQFSPITHGLFVIVRLTFTRMRLADVTAERRPHLENFVAKFALVWIRRTVRLLLIIGGVGGRRRSIQLIIHLLLLLGSCYYWLQVYDVVRLSDPFGLALLR